MSHDVLPLNQRHLHGIDLNSLLRLYDLATGISNHSPLQQERVRANKALQRIARELEKRNVQV